MSGWLGVSAVLKLLPSRAVVRVETCDTLTNRNTERNSCFEVRKEITLKS